MSSRAQAVEPDPAPRAPQAAPPRAEQLIETHKAWIAAAAGMQSRHARRHPRYLRPLAISTGIVAAALLLLSVGRGGESPRGPADFAGELIPTVGAGASRAAPKGTARAFRGAKGEETGRKSSGTRVAERRREPEAGRPQGGAASRPEEPPRIPESAPSLAAAPGAAPQVVADARAAAPEPAAPRTAAADALGPRTASAAPEVQ
jgi:hypothetical protein